MPYKHGVYANLIPSAPMAAASGAFAVPVYVGTAPINTVAVQRVNVPVLLSSMNDAKKLLGYSEDWAKFSLCEAMKAHFDNTLGNIGPVIMVNVLDAGAHTTSGSSSVTPVAKVAWIDKETIVLSSIDIDGKTKGTDYTAEYVLKGGRNQVKITDKTTPGLGTVTVEYDELAPASLEAADIIGEVDTDGSRTGLQVIDLINSEHDLIPAMILAPGWSHLAAVYTAMDAKSRAINGKWETTFAVDIDTATVLTRATAKTWKTTNGYLSERAKVCWPMSARGGHIYHLSTLFAVDSMRIDEGNSGVPYESASNKAADSDGPVLISGAAVLMDEVDANDLNAAGIATLNKAGGIWRLWGANMGNYTYTDEVTILPENVFDSAVRMRLYLANTLQRRYLDTVDDPGSDRQNQSVVDSAKAWLNGLVALGALKAADISYDAVSNPDSETLAGRFKFRVRYNDVRPMTALTFDIMRDGTLVAGR